MCAYIETKYQAHIKVYADMGGGFEWKLWKLYVYVGRTYINKFVYDIGL